MKCLFVFLLFPLLCLAKVRLPAIFSDHMVFQQLGGNPVWGWAEPGEKVTVSTSWGATDSTTADKEGRWMVISYTSKAGTGHEVTIKGTNEIVLKNVAVGEVWLCAGQSNMGWSMGNSFEAEKEATVNLPDFRIFKSAREHWHEPLEENRDRLAAWKPCDPKSAAETSAVSYYFGKKLHQKLGVPVGIIQRAFAGTPIEGWMPWDIQSADPRTIAHKKLLDDGSNRLLARGQTKQKALADYQKELKEYNDKIDRGETMKNAFRSLSPPIISKPSRMGHQYPGHIYNAMIAPIRPYALRGMIWYQGERNAKNAPQAEHYANQLKQLIGHYRNTWHGESWGAVSDGFPVYFTQLPSWGSPQEKPVEGPESPWAVSRESMQKVSQEVYNTGMAVSIDTGDAIELHPKNKKPIGLRHAYLALGKTYGFPMVHEGPVFSEFSQEGSEVILRFESIGSGLMAGGKGKIDSFAIAGEDRAWQWADAKIDQDSVILSSPQVKKPVAVRYAWAMNPSGRNLLYNQEGFPASPFRTDDWPLFDPKAEVVEVNKPKKPKGYQSKDWKRPEIKE
ncbi:MAG: sialate O-acetylesterase [Opitutales bacterium]